MSIANNKRILFVIRASEHFHYNKSIITALGERGFHIRLLLDGKWSKGDSLDLINEFQREHSWFEYGWAMARQDWWRHILFHTRELLSYRRYLIVQEHRQSIYYSDRWRGYLSPQIQRMLTIGPIEWLLKRSVTAYALRTVERVAPSVKSIRKDINLFAPVCVIASPVNMRFPRSDLEYIKAAVALRIPTAIPVISWDNLTTKGLIHVWPDVLLVWNDVQREEARVHQDFPMDRVRIIGAPFFDNWFKHLKPSLAREKFCRIHGLRPEDIFILYLGSSTHMAEDETWLVEDLRRVLNASSDARLKRAQIIVRPHPANFKIYQKLQGRDGIFLLPEKGTLPDSSVSLQLFYDTLYHSVAAIDGANTSAIIDSLIAGKPGIAIITEEYKKTQSETKHFKQLIDADALELANGVKEVPAIIAKLIDGHDQRKEKRDAFIMRYIRPQGIDRCVGEVAADAIEEILKK